MLVTTIPPVLQLLYLLVKFFFKVKKKPKLNPTLTLTNYFPRSLKLNARGNLLDASPKVECSGQPTRQVEYSRHIGRVPTLARLDTTSVFDSPVNDGLVPIK